MQQQPLSVCWLLFFYSSCYWWHRAYGQLQTYAMQYRICATGEAPVRGETGQWSCYLTCVPTDLYRALPCVQQLSLNFACPGIYRLALYDVADAQGFYLTSREVCVYPVFSTCTSNQQRTLCGGVTSPGCLFYDLFDGNRYFNGTCVQPYGVVTAGNVFAACTPAELSQACYADETRCTYDQTLQRLLFQCPWTATLGGGVWTSSNLVPANYPLPVACTDIESEQRCSSDWRTRVPREGCTKYVTRFREYKGHEYTYDLSRCNRRPCTSAEQLSVCGSYSSDCSYLCPTPSSCSLLTPACNSTRVAPTPARYCTEAERLQTGCVSPSAVADECRVRCTSQDLRTGCTLESRCFWSRGYPQMLWNALHLLPNTSQVCTPAEHQTWCGNRDLQDPWRQDASSLCRKLCNAQGVCALRDEASCHRTFCNFAQQTQACNATSPRNSRCSVLTQVSNWTQSSEPYCPSEGYQVNATTAGLVTYSQAYWDSWFSPVDSVRVCNATEFAFSCAPFQVMCRRRCPWTLLDQANYDALTASQQQLVDVSACTLEQKCTLGQVSWETFTRTGSSATKLVRACTTPEWHTTCATTLANCRATCDLSGLNCNITAVCPWTFGGFVPQPARNPNPVECSVSESQFYCGADYTSPCLKYNCTYLGFSDTYQFCTFDVNSCNSRACNATEQLALCGYYTHECNVKCNAQGACTLFPTGSTCGTHVAQYPARPCNATELLDSCAALDNDCRVQCIASDLSWGCVKQNICPWTSGQWIDNQLEPVPYSRAQDFATAVYCGPGWATDSYANNCELYECTNTRRLGRHNCVCHYSTCYCPFRYSDGTKDCSEDEAQFRTCDVNDRSPDNVHSATRYCGRFARACALYCTGDKTAPQCDLISECTCIDDFSFAPMDGLACQGYAQRCNATEWQQCGLYATTCVRSTANETGSSRYLVPEPGQVTCTCLSGVSPGPASGPTCRATRVAADGVTLRACTANETRDTCGTFGASCQYHIGTGRAIPATCLCNATSVWMYNELATYESRSVQPSVVCPGPWALRNCTQGERARCESPLLASCVMNVTLAQPQGVLVNRSQCFPDYFDYPCPCSAEIARVRCGAGYVDCTTRGTYNQIDGCYNLTNTSVTCSCNPEFANFSAELGYTCLNETSVVRNCTAQEFQDYCGRPLAGLLNRCFVFALNNSLVNGTCNRTLAVRDCTVAELAFMCPLAANASAALYCQAIPTSTSGVITVYQTVNASCPFPPAPQPFVLPPLAPANSTGFPRECTEAEYAQKCSKDRVCEVYRETRCNLTEAEEQQLLTLANFRANYSVATNLSILATLSSLFQSLNLTLCTLGNVTVTANGDIWEANITFACGSRLSSNLTCLQTISTNTTVCTQVQNRTALCVANAPSNYTCTCHSGYGPLNPRYNFTYEGFIQSDARDANLGQCEGVVRECAPGEETIVFGGRFATACQISCSETDPTQNCIIYNATCDLGRPALPSLQTILPYEITANELSAFFPLNLAQPCGLLGWLYDHTAAMNASITLDTTTTINITSEIQRRCGPQVERASFLVFDCNVSHSLCEPQTRYALRMFNCTCNAQGYPGISLPCENDYYIRPCNATEDALVPRYAFDDTCMRNYVCKLMCYPPTATQPELCFRHAPDPCLDSFRDQRWCTPQAAQQVCGARGHSCYGRCQVNSDLRFTMSCDPNNLVRCICDTFNTTFFTGLEGKACDRDYIVRRLSTRDNITQWCGILGESGTVRCRDAHDMRTCYQTDACLCQFDAGDGTPLGYVGLQTGVAVNSSAVLINNATLNVTTPRRPVFSHCAYVYSVGNATNITTLVNTSSVVTGTALYRGRKLPWLRRAVVDVEEQTQSVNSTEVVLIDNRPVLIGVPTAQLGFSCDYQQKCGTFTEAAVTYCDTETRKCNVTCGCYRGATTMVGTDTPCSAFIQSCDDQQRARCAFLKNVSFVSSCLATCDELNRYCEPLIGTCVVANPVVIPRFQECTQPEASRYCAPGFLRTACKRQATCIFDPPQLDCFVCDCAQAPGYILDPTLTYGHHCTNLRNEFFNCSATERATCGLRGVYGCSKSLILGGYYPNLFDFGRIGTVAGATTLADQWRAGQLQPRLNSGMYGGVLVVTCTCLSDLFNAQDNRAVVTSQLTHTPTTMRCDNLLTALLTERGSCPFHSTTGMPCNGAGVCEGKPACDRSGIACEADSNPWPSIAVATGSGTLPECSTHGQRWEIARTQGFVWLYSDPTNFESCADKWCDGAPITGRVARQAYPNHRFAGLNTAVDGDQFGTPTRCVSVRDASGAPGSYDEEMMEGMTMTRVRDLVTAQIGTGINLAEIPRAALPRLGFVWDNCMLRQRSASSERLCYDNTGSFACQDRNGNTIAVNPRPPTPGLSDESLRGCAAPPYIVPAVDPAFDRAANGAFRHNMLMNHWGTGRSINCAQSYLVPYPQYVHVCSQPADTSIFVGDDARSLLYYTFHTVNGVRGEASNVVTMNVYDSCRTPTLVQYSRFQFRPQLFTPSNWFSGCVASRTTLARPVATGNPLNYFRFQTNWCTRWSLRYEPQKASRCASYPTAVNVQASLQALKSDRLYCYVAKSTDNMFLWHGISNEVYWTGGSELGLRPLAAVFANLPNRCTLCNGFYSGASCETQVVQTNDYSGWVGLCAAFGTCCGPGQSCVVPQGWDGRVGCVNGVFDYQSHRCVCDPGWAILRPGGPDPGPGGYCRFSACALLPSLEVITRDFANVSNPICSNRGTCLGPHGVCRCNGTDWGGRICELNRFTACPGGNLATRTECSGHGECLMTAQSTASCRCFNLTGAGGYWSGAACDVPHTPDDATCQNNGGTVAVHPLRDVPYCACPTQDGVPIKGGQYCEYSRCPMANGKRCNGKGNCVINGTNAAGYPSFGCRSPLDLNLICSPLDTQCAQTTVAPLVCNSNLDYDGCACEVPIRVYCAASSDQPLCSQSSGTLIDQLQTCQVLTDRANGTTVASCVCPNGRIGAFCQDSVCGDCGTGTCNAATATCVCRNSDLAVNGLWEGARCNVSVTTACGNSLVPGGDLYKCSGHGSCVVVAPGQYGCACDQGHTGAKCELSDCPAPCDERSDCLLPVTGGTQKECICRYPLVWARNTTFPNLCNVDVCKTQSPRFRPNANGTACECIEGGVSFASGCTQAICPADPDTGDVCGQPNPSSSCAEGDCIQGACQVSYDYTLQGGLWRVVGDSRRRKLCNRFQKQCAANSTCLCGLGYGQNPTTGLCTRICDPDHTLDIMPCMDPLDPLCHDARFNPSLSGYDTLFRCRCQPAYSGSKFCDTPLCAHGGQVTPDGQSCTCVFPWTGPTCLDNLCVNGIANFVTNECDCLFGWSGTRCNVNMCENGGTPNLLTQACNCPSKWGGRTCSTINCRLNNFWDNTLGRCVCPPGFKGDICDIPDCNNNKLPDASGNCACASRGQTNQYMDSRCTYRWCGPAGNRVCIGGACICICDDRQGVYVDPITGNCTLPVCGPHSTWSVALATCVCEEGFVKDTSVPLQPCVRSCGGNGVYNSIAGACVCKANYVGQNCEFDVVAIFQSLVPIGSAPVTLPNGIVVQPTQSQTQELQLGESAPSALVQVVLFDPFPDPISYQEDAENLIRTKFPGYTLLWSDLTDLVQQQSGGVAASDPSAVVITERIVQTVESDDSLSTSYYVAAALVVAVLATAGSIIVATYVIAIQQNLSPTVH